MSKTVETPMGAIQALDGEAFILKAKRQLTSTEVKRLRLQWAKMYEDTGKKRVLIVLPDNTDIEELPTGHLQVLRDQIDDVLKERGKYE